MELLFKICVLILFVEKVYGLAVLLLCRLFKREVLNLPFENSPNLEKIYLGLEFVIFVIGLFRPERPVFIAIAALRIAASYFAPRITEKTFTPFAYINVVADKVLYGILIYQYFFQ